MIANIDESMEKISYNRGVREQEERHGEIFHQLLDEEATQANRLIDGVNGTIASLLDDSDLFIPDDIRALVVSLSVALKGHIIGKEINILPDTFNPPAGQGLGIMVNADGNVAEIMVNEHFFEIQNWDRREEQIVVVASYVNDFIWGETKDLDKMKERAHRHRLEIRAARESAYTQRNKQQAENN